MLQAQASLTRANDVEALQQQHNNAGKPLPMKLWQATAAGRTGHSSGSLDTGTQGGPLFQHDNMSKTEAHHPANHRHKDSGDDQDTVVATKCQLQAGAQTVLKFASSRGLLAQGRASQNAAKSSELRSEQVRPQQKS